MDERFLSPTTLPNKFPWYDRRILDGMTTQFGPDKKDKFTVYLTQEAVIDLHVGTFQQTPSEAFGLLMGRAYKDEVGIFTVIERVYYARKLDTSPGHVQLSDLEIRELRLQATRKHPALDFVGWTHSHGEVSSYSDVDYQEQQTWDESYHVGILTFMDGVMGTRGPWAILYRGPSAQMLPFVKDATPNLRKGNKLPPFTTGEEPPIQSQDLVVTQPEIRPQKPVLETTQQPPKGLSKWFSWIVNLKGLFRVILLLAIVIFGTLLGNFLTLQLQPVTSTSSSTGLLWDCNQQSGKVPLSVTCTGPVGPNIQGWSWDFGDSITVQKSTATHVYRQPGIYKITLTVISSVSQHGSTDNINAGSITIKVTP